MKFIILWCLLAKLMSSLGMFSNRVRSANLLQSFPNCSVKAAVPVNLKYNDYSTNNCVQIWTSEEYL